MPFNGRTKLNLGDLPRHQHIYIESSMPMQNG